MILRATWKTEWICSLRNHGGKRTQKHSDVQLETNKLSKRQVQLGPVLFVPQEMSSTLFHFCDERCDTYRLCLQRSSAQLDWWFCCHLLIDYSRGGGMRLFVSLVGVRGLPQCRAQKVWTTIINFLLHNNKNTQRKLRDTNRFPTLATFIPDIISKWQNAP